MVSLKKDFQDFPSEKELMRVIMHTSASVWKNDLVKKHIDNWLENFTGAVCAVKYERLIALWLLSHFTFYNHREVTHLCRVLYRDLIHRIILEGNHHKKPAEIVEAFFRTTTVISSEGTSGSGGFIAYFFRHANDLPMTLFEFSVENVSASVKNIIIIDDVTLTPGPGSQLHKFFLKQTKKHADKTFYLLTLISSSAALDYLRKTFNVKAVSGLELDSRDKCFSLDSDIFSLYPHLLTLGRTFADYYGSKIDRKDPLGYQDGQCAFAFFYNTPDNTLPIFWGQVGGWQPIIGRFHKNYNAQRFLGNERFI